jgi:hypothetical protein
VTAEFLDLANPIVEDVSEDPDHPDEQAVLDTLYAEGGPRPQQDRRILMTYYHGPAVPQGFLFSGFDIWTWQRAQCQSLVDFVFTRIWNVPPHSSATAVAARRPGEAAAWGAKAGAASRSGRSIRRPAPVTRP